MWKIKGERYLRSCIISRENSERRMEKPFIWDERSPPLPE